MIVGAGFAGVACAKELGKHGVAVTLIDKNTYHQFQPLLYQVATAQLVRRRRHASPARAVPQAQDRRREAGRGHLDRSRDHERCPRPTASTFTGDHLVLAMGTEPNFFGVPGAEEHAFPLYSRSTTR